MKEKRVAIMVTSTELMNLMRDTQRNIQAMRTGKKYGLISANQLRAKQRFLQRLMRTYEQEFLDGETITVSFDGTLR